MKYFSRTVLPVFLRKLSCSLLQLYKTSFDEGSLLVPMSGKSQSRQLELHNLTFWREKEFTRTPHSHTSGISQTREVVCHFLALCRCTVLLHAAARLTLRGVSVLCLRMPGDTRTRVGFITFNSTIHFYNLHESLSQPQMLVVSDIDGVCSVCVCVFQSALLHL